MKKPLIEDYKRWVAWKVPDSMMAAQVRATIAKAHLKRQINRDFKPIIEWIMKKLLFVFLLYTPLLIGCTKDVCFECITKTSGPYVKKTTVKTVICGTYSPKEIKEMTNTVTMTTNQIKVTVTCREL